MRENPRTKDPAPQTRHAALATQTKALCPAHGIVERVTDVFSNGTYLLECGTRRTAGSLEPRRGD